MRSANSSLAPFGQSAANASTPSQAAGWVAPAGQMTEPLSSTRAEPEYHTEVSFRCHLALSLWQYHVNSAMRVGMWLCLTQAGVYSNVRIRPLHFTLRSGGGRDGKRERSDTGD